MGNFKPFWWRFQWKRLEQYWHVVFWKWWIQNCLKNVKKARASRAPYFRGSWNCFISPNQSVVDQKHEGKSSHGAVLYIFPKYRNLDRGKICIEYSDVTNYNCNRRGLLTIKGNPAFRQVNKRGYWYSLVHENWQYLTVRKEEFIIQNRAWKVTVNCGLFCL